MVKLIIFNTLIFGCSKPLTERDQPSFLWALPAWHGSSELSFQRAQIYHYANDKQMNSCMKVLIE
ncbi:hypothetical protein EA58_16330 [Photobacterium galatheae]|uniref:Lipoprotein n=1 Tax=Photobacterium galatheae TaxID=1654360 RepID=A0A066RJV2_9GAMM|nr:hypothetical protein EA58_16330 [Photobacterium galatheae]